MDGTETLQQQIDSLNIAQRIIATKTQHYDPMIAFTLSANNPVYNLRDTAVVSKKVLRAYSVYASAPTSVAAFDASAPVALAELP